MVRIERQDGREEVVLPADDQYANVVRHFVHAVPTGTPAQAEAEATLRQARLVGEVESRAVRVTV